MLLVVTIGANFKIRFHDSILLDIYIKHEHIFEAARLGKTH